MQQLGHSTADFCRGIELTFAFAAFSRKVLHQILVCIPKNIIIRTSVLAEVKVIAFKCRYQFG